MTATRVQLTGGVFQDAEGTALASGYLEMVLNQDGSVPGVGQIASGITIKIVLNSSGSVDTVSAQEVWGNDQLLPANSFYRVTGFTTAGQPAWGPNNQQVIGSGGTFDVGTWVPNQVISWTPPLQPLELETNGDLNSRQDILNLTGTGLTTVSESDGTVTIDTPAPSPTPTTWGSILGTLSAQTDLQNALNLKADLVSPALTGNPTAPTQTLGDNTTKLATTAFVQAAVGGGGSSPILVATVTLSSSDILSGFRLPFVPAPGANKIIWPVTWYAEFIPNTTPYSGSGNFDLKTHGTFTDTTWTNFGINGLGFWDQPVKTVGTIPIQQAFGGSSSAAMSVTALANFPLDIVMGTNPTLGDGSVVVTVLYYVLSV